MLSGTARSATYDRMPLCLWFTRLMLESPPLFTPLLLQHKHLLYRFEGPDSSSSLGFRRRERRKLDNWSVWTYSVFLLYQSPCIPIADSDDVFDFFGCCCSSSAFCYSEDFGQGTLRGRPQAQRQVRHGGPSGGGRHPGGAENAHGGGAGGWVVHDRHWKVSETRPNNTGHLRLFDGVLKSDVLWQ